MSNYDRSSERLEEALLESKLLTPSQLSVAKESRKNLGGRLEQIIMDKGYAKEDQILKALAKKMNTNFVALSKYKADPNVVKLLPPSMAKKYRAIPLFKVENKIVIATSDPLNLTALDDIRDALGSSIEAFVALDSDIERAIREFYRGLDLTESDASAKVEVIGRDEDTLTGDLSAEKLAKVASGQKVVNVVNNIMIQSYQDRSSDIHIEPFRGGVRVRNRIDGVLEELTSLDPAMHLPVISRIKIMGGMDVAERRLPQDGRVHLKIDERELDVRIATYPTVFGEAAAIRFLSKESLLTLEALGMLQNELDIFKKLIVKPHGIFLVTGPTGSGKTTTLYAALMKINSKDKHILSIEDPVENEIPGVDQQQVNVKAGMTFATSLRSMLRQDPDVIMVGEIRDQETADIAIRAAMTGHLVFSTLHTNTAVGALPRLLDLGIEPYLASSTLIGVMAQRLVRRICQKCKTEKEVPIELLRKLGAKEGFKAYVGKGCKYCRETGFYGRIGLFEMIAVNDEIREMITNRLTEVQIKEKIIEKGFHTMLNDGYEKVKAGLTTVDEVLRSVSEE